MMGEDSFANLKKIRLGWGGKFLLSLLSLRKKFDLTRLNSRIVALLHIQICTWHFYLTFE